MRATKLGILLMSVAALCVISCSDGSNAGHGELDRSCFNNGTCNETLTCQDGMCTECAPGLESCACAEDGSCADGLVCQNSMCVPYTCDQPGELGCVCDYGDTCSEGLACSPNGQCVECTNDLNGCPCARGVCGTGLVCGTDDTCKRDPSLGIRLVSQCYTPCRKDLITDDGTIRRCSSNGLMRGCVGDSVCAEGSCVPVDHGPRLCAQDTDCPDFQSCEDGQCYSTCQGNNDCGGGAKCHKHVCRMPCDGSEAGECGDHDFCELVDGVTGFCMPLSRQPTSDAQQSGRPGLGGQDAGSQDAGFQDAGSPDAGSQDPDSQDSGSEDPATGSADSDESSTVYSQIFVGRTHVGFSPDGLQQTIELSNDGVVAETFLVRKSKHVANIGKPNESSVESGQGEVLPWVDIGDDELALSSDQTIEFSLDRGESIELVVRADRDEMPERWQGELEIIGADERSKMRPRVIFLSYNGNPDGRWAGNAFYFASFGDSGLDEWVEDRQNNDVGDVGNAFVRQWRGFLASQFTGQPVDYKRFEEVLKATRTESWDFPSVKSICPEDNLGADPICYLSGVSQGYQFYTTDPATNPVPSGVNQMPMALHLRQKSDGSAETLVGKIDSQTALQYPGDPQVRLDFQADPRSCANAGASDQATCVTPLVDMSATSIVAGRYPVKTASDGCPDFSGGRSFTKSEYPWLVPGFTKNTRFDSQTETRYRYECRGQKYPYGPGERCDGGDCSPVRPSGQTQQEAALNSLLSQANPIPDGLQRVRRLSLVDGALIDGDTLFIIFKERMESFMGQTGATDVDFEVYGFMVLTRQPADLEAEDYEGVDLDEASEVETSEAKLTYQCSPDMLDEVAAGSDQLNSLSDNQVGELAEVMLDGRRAAGQATELPVPNPGAEQVHYLCTYQQLDEGGSDQQDLGGSDTASYTTVGVFDQGNQSGDGYCPPDAKVVYFTLDGISDDALASLPCQDTQTCHQVFDEWKSGVRSEQDFGDGQRSDVSDVLRTEPYWECNDSSVVSCSTNRNELRQMKTFYAASPQQFHFQPLDQTIAEAFRFRTQFVGRDGTPVGFAPEICAPNANSTPYCYDPTKIEEIRDRVDCLLAAYNDRRGALRDAGLIEKVRDYLRENFSRKVDYRINGVPTNASCDPQLQPAVCQAVSQMGFERLYSELLIMLGDQAYTESFAARFDLAGIRNASFDGQAFEGDQGINLSGGAGHEMVSLHRAIQYHQSVLDRFYSLSKGINYSLINDENSSIPQRQQESFVTPEMVTLYFDRLILASTQKAGAYSEIAKKYIDLNRPELARRVVERAYVATYLESIIFSRLMDSFGEVARQEDKPQIKRTLEQSQRKYRTALLDMQEVYQNITNERTVFGFAPDFVPFPVLGAFDANAFERMVGIAQRKVDTAADKETLALDSNRSRKTSTAEFQNELNEISNEYEGQLQTVCGAANGSDGTLYPAIAKYAPFFKNAGVLGQLAAAGQQAATARQLIMQDPCGRFGEGELYEARKDVVVAELDYKTERQEWKNLLTEMDLTDQSVEDLCDINFDITTDPTWTNANDQVTSLETTVLETEQAIDGIDRKLAAGQAAADAANVCASGTIGALGVVGTGKKIAAGIAAGTACAAQTAVAAAGHSLAIDDVNENKGKIVDAEDSLADWETKRKVAESKWEHSRDCEKAKISRDEDIGNLIADTLTQRIAILKAIKELQLKRAEVSQQRAKAERLTAEYEESENLAVNLQAAEFDPNVRIFKNDAVLAADRTFESALEATYKATKVFEYMTSQSYAGLEELFLVRTVTFGEHSLESYLADLRSAYVDYQETFGRSDLRLMMVSVRDDIFQTQLYGPDNMAASQSIRDEDFRRILQNDDRLDDNGYITIPFSTALSQTSPLTNNHKIEYVQAELIYDGQTDVLARVYLRQRGTGIVLAPNGERNFYRFPERTAVINPFFNGRLRQLDASSVRNSDVDQRIFRTFRFKDRPLINTDWEIVLNLLDEQVNGDVDPAALKDIRLYVYYSDFTDL